MLGSQARGALSPPAPFRAGQGDGSAPQPRLLSGAHVVAPVGSAVFWTKHKGRLHFPVSQLRAPARQGDGGGPLGHQPTSPDDHNTSKAQRIWGQAMPALASHLLGTE